MPGCWRSTTAASTSSRGSTAATAPVAFRVRGVRREVALLRLALLLVHGAYFFVLKLLQLLLGSALAHAAGWML